MSGQEYYDESDDSLDPCPLCVGWEPDPADPWAGGGWPINVDGTRIARLYNKIHSECAASVERYVAEHQGESW